MHYANQLTFIVLVGVVSWGCIPPFSSGGGSFHTPPPVVDTGTPTTLVFELTISGVAGEGANDRFANEKVFYRANKGDKFRAATTTRRVVDEKRIDVSAEIPAIDNPTLNRLEYFLTFQFDGVKNSRGSGDAPMSAQIRHHQNK
jgi:hypothetical protein